MKNICLLYLVVLFPFFMPITSFAVELENSPIMENTQAMPDLLGDDDFYDDEGGEEWNNDIAAVQDASIADPFEPVNRVFFTFNDKLYDWVLEPVSDGYCWLFPYELRQCFGNFFDNLGAPLRLLNSILQGNSDKSLVIVQRFFINSTIGGLGFFDMAQQNFDLELQKSDFGQTLGRWGFGFGPYIYAPFLGPSSVRGLLGRGGDVMVSPVRYIYDDWWERGAFFSVEKVNTISLHPGLYEDLRKITLDPYVATRQAYYDYRSQVVAESMPKK